MDPLLHQHDASSNGHHQVNQDRSTPVSDHAANGTRNGSSDSSSSGQRMSIMNIMNDPPPKPTSPSPSTHNGSSIISTTSEIPATFPFQKENPNTQTSQISTSALQQPSTLSDTSISTPIPDASTLSHSNGSQARTYGSAIPSSDPDESFPSFSQNGPTAILTNGSDQLPPSAVSSPTSGIQPKLVRAPRGGKSLPTATLPSSSRSTKSKGSKASGSGAMNPPSKRKRTDLREDDGWTSDLEDPANQATFSTEIELYKQSLANRYLILEEEYKAQMRLKAKFVQQRAELAYTKRFDAVIKRVEWEEKKEHKKRQEADRREREREVKRMRKELDQDKEGDSMMGDGYGLLDDQNSLRDLDSSSKFPNPSYSRAITPEMINFEPLPPRDPQTGLIPISDTRASQLDQAHRQIWSSIACKEIPAVYRLTQYSAANKAQYWRRISTVAAREARKGLNKSNKSNRDILLKTRKTMREMLMFWKS